MITVVGEALLDLVAEPDGRSFAAHPGGSPANVAVGLARLGAPVTLATQLADDLAGRLVAGHLRDSGVAVELLPGRSPATSLALAALDSGGGATYDFRLTWDITRGPAVDPDCLCLHTGSIAAALSPGATVVEDLMAGQRRRGLTISYDPNIRPSLIGAREAERARVERQVGRSDVVKASAEDLEWLYPGRDPETMAAQWLATGPALVVVTLGANGAHARSHAGAVTRPPLPITVVDTVGAGDAFTAGLLDALLRGGLLGAARRDALASLDTAALIDVIDFATRVAGITCGRPGAHPPTRAELDAEAVQP
ncbi:MAG: carbohydrate kinase [Micromonosporaceae bacterium]|nr:carbohydrate kinase [Micromonosporaceae bacterium]